MHNRFVRNALIVPSDDIKIVGFDVAGCRTNAATIDFEGVASIEFHPADGKWLLRPVIQLMSVADDGPGDCGDDADEAVENESAAK